MCDRVIIWITSIPSEFHSNLDEYLFHFKMATAFSKNLLIFYGKTDDPRSNVQEIQKIITAPCDSLSFVHHHPHYELETSTFESLLDKFDIMWPRAKFKVVAKNRSHFMVGIDL
jgi:hypothetical protein